MEDIHEGHLAVGIHLVHMNDVSVACVSDDVVVGLCSESVQTQKTHKEMLYEAIQRCACFHNNVF